MNPLHSTTHAWRSKESALEYFNTTEIHAPNRILIGYYKERVSCIRFWRGYVPAYAPGDGALDPWKSIDIPLRLLEAPHEEVQRYAETMWRLDDDPQLVKP